MVRARRNLAIVCIALMSAALLVIAPVVVMRICTAQYLYTDQSQIPPTFVALIPGASVVHGEPSPILALRADLGAALYKNARVQRILITGDNGEKSYDEVTPVVNYLRNSGIPESDMLLDRAGYSTYTSLYRAKKYFNVQSLVVVTQDFHLPRSVFIARSLGINAYGLATTQGGTVFDYVREIPASWKALIDIVLQRIPQEPRQPVSVHLAQRATTAH